MSEFLRDMRFGLRLLGRSPVFTASSVLLLAIGISANTLIFSVFDALLLRALPVSHPEELVRLVEVHSTGFVTWDLPYGLCEALAARSKSFSQVLCQSDADVGLSDGKSTERVRVNLVTPNFFTDLHVGAQMGRVLLPEDEHAQVMAGVLSHDFWQRRFHGDRGILGRRILLNAQPFVVAGVLPKRFNGLTVDTSPDIRVPMAAERWLVPQGQEDAREKSLRVFVQIFGRLRPGVTRERAEAETRSMLPREYGDLMVRLYPKLGESAREQALETRFRLEPAANGVSTLRAQFSRGLVVLMAAVALLLLMACANVAGLLMARAAARSTELGIRLALGAGPWRLARQLLTESLLLALLGGAAGILLTYACLPLLMGLLPAVRDRAAVLQPLAVHVDIDLRVLGFALCATLLTALLFGLSPALAGARADVMSALRGARGSTRRLSTRNLVVVAQVAACTLLLIGAALLVQTLERMRWMNAGFDRDHVVTFTVDPHMRGYQGAQTSLLGKTLIEKTAALPSVSAASIANRALMRGTGFKGTFGAAGARVERNDFLNCSLNSVTPGYFESMGIHLVAGRDFTWFDNRKEAPHASVVNEAFVRRFFPDQNPIGKRFGGADSNHIAKAENEIVGVVSDAHYRSLREEIPPTVYSLIVLPETQFGFVLQVRTKQRPEAIIGAVRQVLHSIDPELPFVEVHTLHEEVEMSLWQERLLAALASVFGAIAALLAGIGLYGALDYAVKARTREIGVRVALGAEPARILRLLAGETVLLVAGGAALGLAAYALSAEWMRQVLYDVRVAEPVALGAAFLLIGVIAALAAAPPIWRAVRIDPASALRQE